MTGRPRFWDHDGLAARLLAPLGAIYGAATAWKVARPGWRAPVPVICVGNATAGGTGKTTVALDIGTRLAARGRAPAFLTRGHGGRGAVRRVEAGRDTAADVGDEPLLLATIAPTYAGADRAVTARMALDWGALSLVMDDGLQNPTLRKDLSLLVIDGPAGVGNGRCIPAGPLREPLAAAAARCQAAVLIGEDRHKLADRIGIPVHRARLVNPPDMEGRRVLAFAGIGRPDKFFDGLRAAGAEVAASRAFADHHRFSDREIAAVLREADRLHAEPVTTAKDAARLTPAQRARIRVVPVALAWDDPAALDARLDSLFTRR